MNSWLQRPHLVSRGGEKNFREFTIQLKDKSIIPDEAFFQKVVAQAILFKRTERIVQDMALGGYRANVVAYTISLLARLTDGSLDLDAIWKAQQLSPQLEKFMGALARKVHEVLITPPGNANITEWCKKEQCWNAVRAIKSDVPAAILPPGPEKKRRKASALKDDENDDFAMTSSGWIALAAWAASSKLLPPRDRHALTAIASLFQLGRTPSSADLAGGIRLMEKARQLGFDHADG